MAQPKEISCLDLSNSKVIHFDIIIRILSWLPVESLLRFKCVRKQWFSLIDGGGSNNNFIEIQSLRGSHSMLHYYQTKPDLIYLVPSASRPDFKYIAFRGGLCLEQHVNYPHVARVRNPATHQVFYLPLARKSTIDFAFAFDPFNDEFKVVCAYGIEYGCDDNGVCDWGGVGFDVLTVGKDEQWRHLKHPNEDKYLENGELIGFAHGLTCQSLGFVHAFVTVTSEEYEALYVELYHLDVLSESFVINTLQYGAGISNMINIRFFIWDDCLALSEIIDDNLVVLVLEDFEKHKWSEIKIIPLEILKTDPALKDKEDGTILVSPKESRRNQLLFYNVGSRFLLHDVETNSTQSITFEQVAKEKLSPLKSSLVNIKHCKRKSRAGTY